MIEIKTSLTHREMFVHLPMIVVKMDLAEILAQGIEPDGERGFAKEIVMPCIEAEPEMG